MAVLAPTDHAHRTSISACSYTAGLFQNRDPGVVGQTCEPSTWEAEDQLRDFLGYIES